ncbi:hypothetical protein DXG01_013789, partial [Tephrocybe rancida]
MAIGKGDLIPNEIWEEVLKDADMSALKTLSTVCKHFHWLTRIFEAFHFTPFIYFHDDTPPYRVELPLPSDEHAASSEKLRFFTSASISLHIFHLYHYNTPDDVPDAFQLYNTLLSFLPSFPNLACLSLKSLVVTSFVLRQISLIPRFLHISFGSCFRASHLSSEVPIIRARTLNIQSNPDHEWLSMFDTNCLEDIHCPWSTADAIAKSSSPQKFPCVRSMTLILLLSNPTAQQILRCFPFLETLIVPFYIPMTDINISLSTESDTHSLALQNYTGPHELLDLFSSYKVSWKRLYLRSDCTVRCDPGALSARMTSCGQNFKNLEYFSWEATHIDTTLLLTIFSLCPRLREFCGKVAGPELIPPGFLEAFLCNPPLADLELVSLMWRSTSSRDASIKYVAISNLIRDLRPSLKVILSRMVNHEFFFTYERERRSQVEVVRLTR